MRSIRRYWSEKKGKYVWTGEVDLPEGVVEVAEHDTKESLYREMLDKCEKAMEPILEEQRSKELFDFESLSFTLGDDDD